MQEKNRQYLETAINQLPVYEPDEAVWSNIAHELEVQEAIPQLPSYAPPVEVWETIHAQLESEAQEKTGRIRQLRPRWAAAASVAVLIIAGLWLWPKNQSGDQFTYEATTVEAVFVTQNDWDTDEEALQMVVQTYRNDPLARQNDQYDAMLSEWEELNSAKEEIKAMMDQYGHDSRLVRQLGSIERDRSAVVKEMAIQI
jgi:hypothetical protein